MTNGLIFALVCAIAALVYGVGAVLQVAMSFLLLPVYTSQLSTGEFAVLNLALTTASLAGSLFYLGAYSALSRFYFDHEGADRRRAVASTAITITLIGAALQMVSVALAARPLASMVLGSVDHAGLLVLALAGSALTFVNQIFLLVLRLHRRSTAVVVANLAALAVTAAAVLGLVFVWRWGVTGALLGTLIGQAAIAPVLLWLSRDVFVWRIEWSDAKQQVAFGLPAIVIGFGAFQRACAQARLLRCFWTGTRAFGLSTASATARESAWSAAWRPSARAATPSAGCAPASAACAASRSPPRACRSRCSRRETAAASPATARETRWW